MTVEDNIFTVLTHRGYDIPDRVLLKASLPEELPEDTVVMALEAGLDPHDVHDWLTGYSHPSEQQLRTLCDGALDGEHFEELKRSLHKSKLVQWCRENCISEKDLQGAFEELKPGDLTPTPTAEDLENLVNGEDAEDSPQLSL